MLYVLDPLTEAYSESKDIKLLCNNNPEEEFKETKQMVTIENFLNYTDQTITFTMQNDEYDKQLGTFISKNYNTIYFYQGYL